MNEAEVIYRQQLQVHDLGLLNTRARVELSSHVKNCGYESRLP